VSGDPNLRGYPNSLSHIEQVQSPSNIVTSPGMHLKIDFLLEFFITESHVFPICLQKIINRQNDQTQNDSEEEEAQTTPEIIRGPQSGFSTFPQHNTTKASEGREEEEELQQTQIIS
jgi:hypothetical protein